MAKRLSVMVSSSVYGNQGLLNRVANLLGANYKVWISDLGTLPLDSRLSAFENCLEGVRNCDIFLGIVTGNYGSGVDRPGDVSITHQEMRLALTLPKLRFALVDHKVIIARQLLRPFRLSATKGPFEKVEAPKRTFALVNPTPAPQQSVVTSVPTPSQKGIFQKAPDTYQLIQWPRHNPIITDLKVLDLYDELIQANSRALPSQREGNWVQEYKDDEAALRFIDAQLGDVKRIRKIVASY